MTLIQFNNILIVFSTISPKKLNKNSLKKLNIKLCTYFKISPPYLSTLLKFLTKPYTCHNNIILKKI